MIKNDKQYQVTKRKLSEFAEALIQVQNQDIDPLLKELQTNALQSQIEEFQTLIEDYKQLQTGNVNSITIAPLEQLSEVLIKGRIARGLTQAELATRLDLDEQQIQRYEANNYATASIQKIISIVNALGLIFHPVKVDLKAPNFLIPVSLNTTVLANAKRKLKTRKTLLV